MTQLSRLDIWGEMIRRKKQFHNTEEWDAIKLWGLFYKSEIKREIKSGQLVSCGEYAPRALGWYRPSEKAYKQYIEQYI